MAQFSPPSRLSGSPGNQAEKSRGSSEWGQYQEPSLREQLKVALPIFSAEHKGHVFPKKRDEVLYLLTFNRDGEISRICNSVD